MTPKVIPLILSREEANALIDLWEAWAHEHDISPKRYQHALSTVEWLRTSIQALGKPTKYPMRQRLVQAWRNFRLRTKYLLLIWRNEHKVINLPITEQERIALLKLLVLHRAETNVKPIIERLHHAGRIE